MPERATNFEKVQVAAMLRAMREDAELTREQAAHTLACTTSKIGDLEVGRSAPKLAELEKLLDLYGIGADERADLLEFARASRSRAPRSKFAAVAIPPTQRRVSELERQAIAATFFSGELLPGILQTERFATAMLRWANTNTDAEVHRLLELRMRRAASLRRTDREPLRYWCVLGEAALRTGVGGPEVMREQIEHLLELTETTENVTVQVLPIGAGMHGLLGMTATLYRFPPPAPDIVQFDTHNRDTFADRETDVARTAHHLDLARAMALSPQESSTLMRSLLHNPRNS